MFLYLIFQSGLGLFGCNPDTPNALDIQVRLHHRFKRSHPLLSLFPSVNIEWSSNQRGQTFPRNRPDEQIGIVKPPKEKKNSLCCKRNFYLSIIPEYIQLIWPNASRTVLNSLAPAKNAFHPLSTESAKFFLGSKVSMHLIFAF